MPSMFSRRRASSQPPRPSAPPSASAAIAASSAFLQSSTSTGTLSSAAAAAALRSHATSPEPVGNIQTKRMVRRGSQSSIGSNSVMARPGAGRGMSRRDSNSSMTERTFRSPSPGRRGDYDSVPSASDAPPVPTIPTTVPRGQRRSASVEPMSMRVTSPTPKRGGRNASLDRINLGGAGRGSVPSAATIAASSAALARPRELEREDSQRSVNFSRPMSPGPSAPPARPASAAGYFTTPKGGPASPRTTAAARPQSSLAMSAMQARKVEQDIQNAANKPVMKKKKKAVAANEGDRLANGTMHPGPTGTFINTPASPALTAQSAPQPTVSEVTPVKKKKKRVAPAETEATTEPPPKNPARFSPSRDGATSPTSPRAAGMLQKQPSMVREEPEAEYMAEKESTLATTRSPARAVSLTMQPPRRVISTSEGPARAYVAPSGQRAASLDIPRDTTSRSASLSPSRNHAHFSDVVANTPANKHQPPPRSVSPFKSALKHSPASSVRGTSPGAPANGTRPPPSDASDTTSLASQDGVKPANKKKKKKKKSARVSFDDGGTTVSEPVLAATPNTSKTIRRELSPVAAIDSDVDEVMTPRPALPAFGSVRGRKPQSHSPEPPEKVTQTVPSHTTITTTSDHALGALVANDFADKRKQHQSPAAPPQVTSVEGSGYASDSSAYSQELMPADKYMDNLTSETATEPPAVEYKEFVEPEVVAEEAASEPAATEPPAATRSANDIIARVLSAPVVSASGNEVTPAATLSLPNISVQPATPGLDEEGPILEKAPTALSNNGYSRYSIPGGWEESEGSKSDSTTSRPPHAIEMEEPDLDSSEDEDDEDDEDTLEAPGIAAERHSPNLEPIYESDSDDSAAFSDAPEDPSEFDGGFASLDAIVESPASRHSAARALSTPPDSPSSRLPPPRMSFPQTSPLATNSPITAATPDDEGDWSKATSYWSSLTREKREAMERQAQATTESDPSVLQQPKSKKRTQATSPVLAPVTEPVTQTLEPPAEPRSVSKQPEPRAPVLKKSMRSPAPAPASSLPVNGDAHLRKSMRPVSGGGMKTSMRPEQGGGGMKTSMRGEHTPRSSVDNEPRGALQHKRAPSAQSIGSLGAAATAVKKATPAATAKAPTATALADDSDSESSFRKKKRRGSVSTVDSAGHYNMKRSMRGSSVDMTAERRPLSPTPAPRGSGGLSVRSLSPNGSFMGRNKGESIRASLRGDPVDDTPTMRGKSSKAMRDSKSPTRFSMSGFSKPPRQASSSVPPTKTGGRSSGMFKSRFADSDDEDEPSSRMGFRSRFVDSDDEDSPVAPLRQMPSNLPPVRGIPRSQNRYADDSTDLEDSEDEGATRSSRTKNTSRPTSSKKPVVPSQSDIDAAMAAARRNVAAMNGGREPGVVPEADQQLKKQVTLESEPQTNGVNGAPPPTTPTKRRGIFGSMLGRRRTSSVASVPQIPSTYYAPSAPSSPAPKSEMIASPQGKLKRKTTKRMSSTMSSMSAAPVSQTRDDANPPGSASTNSQNWPLPSSSEGDRPLTSDGADAAHLRRTMRGGGGLGPVTRPEIKRRSMSSGDIDRMTTKAAVYSEKTGKKKRFGLLRRAFGLND